MKFTEYGVMVGPVNESSKPPAPCSLMDIQIFRPECASRICAVF